MEEKESKTTLAQRVADQVVALRHRLEELGKARGVAVELSDLTTFAEVLETLGRLDVEPGRFFVGLFAAAEAATLRKRLHGLAAARGVELDLSEELAVTEVLEALETLDVSPADFFAEVWPVAEVAPPE